MTVSIDRQLRAYSDFFESQLPTIDLDDVLGERVAGADSHAFRDDQELVTYLPPREPSTAGGRTKTGRAVAAIAAVVLLVAGVVVASDEDGRDVGTDVGSSPGVSDSAPSYEWSRVILDTATSDQASPWVYGVTVGGPGLVAVGAEDTVSLDGDWADWSSVDRDAVVWTSVDRDAVVWTSVDGIAWSQVPHDEAVFGGAGIQEMWDVTAGGPGLVAVGSAGPFEDKDAAVWTSVDGVSWSRVPHDETVFGGASSQVMNAVTTGGPGLVAVGRGGSSAAVWTSGDGITWTRVPHDPAIFGNSDDNESAELHDVTSGGPGLVAVGHMGRDNRMVEAVWTSGDGLTWTRAQRQILAFAVTAGGPGLVAVGDSSVWVSEDGTSWTPVPRDPTVFGESGSSGVQLHGAITTGSGLVAVGGADDAAAAWTSVDGVEWSRVPHDEQIFGGQGLQYMLDVASTGAGLVAVGRTSQRVEYPSGQPTVWVATATDGPAPSGPERVGFIGLPPEGAASSTADGGETVLERLWCSGPTIGNAGLDSCPGAIWVYADGRVIWYVHANLPEGANPRSTGFLEQRLTPEGVAYFIENFRPKLWTMTPGELGERLRDPLGWPADTWLDQTIRPYLAATYGVCFQPIRGSDVRSGNPDLREGNELDAPRGWSQLLELLPESAHDIARTWSWGENRQQGPTSGFFVYCADRSTNDARALADALSESGVDQGLPENSYELEYRLDDLPSGNPVHLVFYPNIPDGAENYAVG